MHSKGIYTRTVSHPVVQDGRQLVIKLNQRRWKCTNPICGFTQNDNFSFIDPYCRSTSVTDLLIVTAFKDPQMTAKQIAETYGVSDTHAITTFSRYVDMPTKQLTEAICIDTDMYRPYHNFVDIYFPNAISVIDSFHVVKMINGHLHKYLLRLIRKYRDIDERRHYDLEQRLGRKIDFTSSKEYYFLKKFEWIILKNNDDIIYSDKPKFNHKLRRYVTIGEIESMIFDIDTNLKNLRDLKEKYIRFNRQYGGKYKEAKEKLLYIIDEYDSCPYKMFHTIADSLRYHFDAIINSFIMVERHCKGDAHIKRLSNGPAEALNRIIKDMKRNGRGYRNFEHLRNRFLYSQRANAAILGTPKPLEEVLVKTGEKRGPYSKKDR